MQHQTITKVEDIVFQYPHHREAVKELISIFREKHSGDMSRTF
mgnify:CR=1 FL=1